MTKPTTAEALKIARDALIVITQYYDTGTKACDIALNALEATADVQDHIHEAEKMMLTDEEIISKFLVDFISEQQKLIDSAPNEKAIRNWCKKCHSVVESMRYELAAQAKKAREQP